MNTVRKIAVVRDQSEVTAPLGALAHLAGCRVYVLNAQDDRAYVNYRTSTGDYARGWVSKSILRTSR